MQVNCHPLPEKNQGTQRIGMLAKCDKRMETKKIAFCQVFTYPYSNPPWMTY